MQVQIDDILKNQPELANGIDETLKLLRTEIGASRYGTEVTAELRSPDVDIANGAVLELKLSDAYGSFSRTFSVRDLNDCDRLIGRIRSMWIDLLQVRTNTHLRRAEELAAQIVAEEEG